MIARLRNCQVHAAASLNSETSRYFNPCRSIDMSASTSRKPGSISAITLTMSNPHSVPYTLLKQEVEVHANAQSVVIDHQGARVAIHAPSYRKCGHPVLPEHRPKARQAMAEWSPKRFLGWAASIGSETRVVVEHIFQEKRHPEQSYRRILALLSNAKKFSPERLNRACGRALLINSPTRTSVESILKHGRDQSGLADAKMAQQTERGLDDHENIRGETYYH